MQDPESAYEYSEQIADPNQRSWFTRGVFFRWAQRDPAGVVQVLNAGGVTRDEEMLIINAAMRGLATRDPASPFEHALTVEDSAVRSAALRIVTGIWAPKRRVVGGPSHRGYRRARSSSADADTVVTSLVQESTDLALEWALSMDNGNGQTWQKALQVIADTDLQLAVNHALSAPSDVDRDRGMSAVVQGLAQSNPEVASFYLSQIADETTRPMGASVIAREWVQRDARAAERWAMSLAQGAVRENALSQVVSLGSYSSSDAARIINAIRDSDVRFNVALQQTRRLLGSNELADAPRLAMAACQWEKSRDGLGGNVPFICRTPSEISCASLIRLRPFADLPIHHEP